MIGFTNSETPLTEKTDQVLTEGLIGDTLKAASGIDPEKVKDDWEDAEGAGHVGVINDDILKPLKSQIDKGNTTLNKNKVDNRSIIARSRNSIMQFPIYITQTIRVNEAHIISKLFERVYASLFQSILATNPLIDQEELNDLVFLKKFHTNLKESTDFELYNEFYTPIDTVDEIMKESVYFHEQVTPTMEVFFRKVDYKDRFFESEAQRMMCEPLAGLFYLKEANDKLDTDTKETTDNVKYVTVTEKEIQDIALDRCNLSPEARRILNAPTKDLDDGEKDRWKKYHDQLEEEVKKVKEEIKSGKFKNYDFDGVRYRRKENTKVIKSSNSSREVEKKQEKDMVNRAVDAPKMLRDADIKKINGMLPYTIEATFRVKPSDGGMPYEVHFIIGVKTVLHLIRTQDLTDDLREIVTGKIKSLQKVRYKTGEITFADYLFNKKGIKADAAKSVNYNKKWLTTLKRLSEWEKQNGGLLKQTSSVVSGGHVPIPNGTIVLAQTDVTTMMNQTGIDLSVVSNAKRLARSLFLIAVCIVDSSAGTMRVLFTDSDNDWDVQSLGAIDAELSKTDNSQLMRELNRMVNH